MHFAGLIFINLYAGLLSRGGNAIAVTYSLPSLYVELNRSQEEEAKKPEGHLPGPEGRRKCGGGTRYRRELGTDSPRFSL